MGAARGAASSIVHAVGASAGHIESAGLGGIKDVVGASVKTVASASALARRVVRRGRKGDRLLLATLQCSVRALVSGVHQCGFSAGT